MAAPEAGIDVALRARAVDAITTQLHRLLKRDGPITEDMLMAEHLGLSSSLGLELLLEVEEMLQVQIDVETMDPERTRTVGELATFVAGHGRPW
jgi:acyl carrier protein